MKILQINCVSNSGSTGRIAEGIGNFIKKNGSDSYIAFSRFGNKSESIPLKIGNKADVYKHIIFTRLFDRHGFASASATKEFIEEIEIVDPDIIHLHNIHGYYIHIGLLFNYLETSGKPVIWTLHDCWAFTGHCTYFDRVGCDKWQTQCYSCPLTKYYPSSWGLDNSKRNYIEKKKIFNSLKNLTIVTPSIWLKNLVKESFLKNYETKVINNGLDIEIFRPTLSNIREKFKLQDEFIILGVANIWDKRKGLDDFVALSKKLNSSFKIILIGLKESQINSLPENIIGIKRTENICELIELYSSASVFLNPTHSDNFPTTNIEALACGTPVITYDTGGSAEAVDHETGIIVHKNDIEGLKNAILRILSNNENYTLEKCRKRALNFFDQNIKYREYFDIYQTYCT